MIELAQARHERTEAMYHFEKGHLPEAEAQLDAVIDKLSSAATPQLRCELGQALTDRATVHRYANRWEEALKDLQRCQKLTHQMGTLSAGLLAKNVDYLCAKIFATPYAPFYDRKKALAALRRVRRAGGLEFACDELESQLAFRAKDWERAAKLALRAAQTLEGQGWKRAAASCRGIAGRAWLGKGDLRRAESQLLAAHRYLEQFGGPSDLVDSNLALARLHAAQGHGDRAWTLALEGLSFLEHLIRRFSSIGEQQRFLIDKLQRYHEVFEIALARGGDEAPLRAWTIAERSKSFYLCQLLASADIRFFEGVRPEDIDSLRTLEHDLDKAERTLGRLYASGRQDAETQRLEMKTRQLAEEKQGQLELIMKQDPRWGSVNVPSQLHLDQELSCLPSGWVPVSFYWHRSQAISGEPSNSAEFHVFWMDRSGRPHRECTSLAADEIRLLEAHREQLSGEVDPLAQVFPDSLGAKIFPPNMRADIPLDSRLLISPHGPLQMLPLHAMRLDSNDYLIEQWAVQYIPTLALLPLRRNSTKRDSVLLIGSSKNGFGDPPLPQVETELEYLTTTWSKIRPNGVTCRLIEPDGSPEDAGIPPRMWEAYDQIHIACHGVFPEGRAFDAALRLGSDAVRASELFTIRLNARLVTLSACQVGRQAARFAGMDVVGGEWVGLLLALLYAGADRVVASAWNANSEEAVSIMHAMNELLAVGEVLPADALRTALKTAIGPSLPPLWANWFIAGLPD